MVSVWYYNNGQPLGDIEYIDNKRLISDRTLRKKLQHRLTYYHEEDNDAFVVLQSEPKGKEISHVTLHDE